MSTVALIDDHESVRLGLEAACARDGQTVVFSGSTVGSYLEWRRATGAPPADVVVLDLTLGDGTTVTENVRALVGTDEVADIAHGRVSCGRCAVRVMMSGFWAVLKGARRNAPARSTPVEALFVDIL